jgi:hypothetical protein
MENIDQAKGPIPGYLPFKTFQSAVDNLRSHGMPTKIDRTTWASRSGADQQQILTAFKFMGLIDDSERPQEVLKKLVDAKANSPEEKEIIGQLLRQKYAKVFEHDLTKATPMQLSEAIGSYGATGSTRARCERFFLRAAEFAGIPLSLRLTKGMSTTMPGTSNGTEDGSRPANGERRRRRRKSATSSEPDEPIVSHVDSGNAMKTIQLPGVGGSLTISGTFNPFGLMGEERKLVYEIIDKMNEFETNFGQKEEADNE